MASGIFLLMCPLGSTPQCRAPPPLLPPPLSTRRPGVGAPDSCARPQAMQCSPRRWTPSQLRLRCDFCRDLRAHQWLTWSIDGSLASGPWVPPTLAGNGGNAAQSVASGVFNTLVEAGSQRGVEPPFALQGTVPDPTSLALVLAAAAAAVAAARRPQGLTGDPPGAAWARRATRPSPPAAPGGRCRCAARRRGFGPPAGTDTGPGRRPRCCACAH